MIMEKGREAKSMNKYVYRSVLSALLTFALLLTAAVPAWADSASDLLVLRLKLGSTTAVINDEPQKIAKPYKEQGTMMVPLGVFKKAFGSEVRLEKTNVVKVLYGPHIVSMTIDSPIAWVDGHKEKLNTAPKMVDGTLMVPLRFVAEGIGAKVSGYSAEEPVITLLPSDNAQEEKAVDTDIDSDMGKTKVGNSYYEWTMNYPAGMVVGDGQEDESIVTFNDADSKYYMEVHVSNQDVVLDADDLLEQLVEDTKDGGEVILDRESFPQAKTPYARIISKDGDGTLWESRLYYDHGRLYELYLADMMAANYKDLGKYAGLLNSFTTKFNGLDRTVKDLSTVKNGMRSAYNGDYGISLAIPAGWSIDNPNMYYADKDGSYLKVNVSSAPKGSTQGQWSGQMKTWLGETFVPKSYEIVDTFPLNVSEEAAIVNQIRYNYGDGWTSEYEVMLQKDGYRYYFEYSAPEDRQDSLEQFKKIMRSVEVDFSVVSDTFGHMEEDTFLINKTKRATKISKPFQYKIDIPQYWTANVNKFELSTVEYQFTGGRFMITVDKDTSREAAASQAKAFYNDAAKSQKDLKIETVEDITFAGVPATSITLHQVKNGIPYSGRQIFFENNGMVYTISASLNDANATDIQKAAIEQTLKSFEFTK